MRSGTITVNPAVSFSLISVAGGGMLCRGALRDLVRPIQLSESGLPGQNCDRSAAVISAPVANNFVSRN